MDLSHSQEGASSSSRKRKHEEDDPSEIVPPKHVCYTPPTHRQNWSLPESIIYYLAKNPKSPELYQKLIKTCKYFFYKNPVIVCSGFFADVNASQMDVYKNGESKFIDLNNISQRFWITNLVAVDSDGIAENHVLSSIIVPHIYRCDAADLLLTDQHISWNEYLFLTANAEIVTFVQFIVTNECGSIVPVEKLFEVAVNVTKFTVVFNGNDQSVSSKTVQNLLQIPHFATIKEFHLDYIPDSFNIDTFFTYIKKNKHTLIYLHFSQLISDAYKNRLESIIDEILDAESHDYKVPMITFDGLDGEKRIKLRSLYERSRHDIHH